MEYSFTHAVATLVNRGMSVDRAQTAVMRKMREKAAAAKQGSR